jgi:hypothetical protein
MILIRLFFAFLAIVFGSIIVYFGVSGHRTLNLFGIVLTWPVAQAVCIVCVVALVLFNWKLVASIFDRATGG